MMKFKRFLPVLIPKKNYCSAPKLILEHQKNRSLISVEGEEASSYLQGLITNDIRHIEHKNTSQYAMFLNSKGRIICDSIIYKIDKDQFFIECDSSIGENLEKHLKLYKIRRKIDIRPVNFEVHTMFDENCYEEALQNISSRTSTSTIYPNFNQDDLKLFKDPRIPQLGYRILAKTQDIDVRLSEILKVNFATNTKLSYKKLRYCLGVGEGTQDLPTGNCFPLECNCDYLHGVSFHKGCYIGQELTARTYHTGVTRKRLMPIHFNENLNEIPSNDTIIHDKLKLGKLRGIVENVGLALLRIDLIKSLPNFKIAEKNVVVAKPFWWPVEASKSNLCAK